MACPTGAFQDTTLHDRAQTMLQKGQALLLAGQTTQALALIQEARNLQITLSNQYRDQGQNLWRLGDFVNAQSALEKALENNYEDPITHLFLGKVHLETKAYQSAFTHLEKSLQLNPDQYEAEILLKQAIQDHYHLKATSSLKHYTFPCQNIAFQESDSLRLEIAYALPKVGLASAGGVGVVHIDQAIETLTRSGTQTHLTKLSRLPEYGETIIEKNYLLATHTLRVPTQTTQLNLNIKDRHIYTLGVYQTTLSPPAEPYQFGLSEPLLAQSISTRNDHPQTRTDFDIVPNPLRLYQSHTPLTFYIELYNLQPTAWGSTDFELSYQILWPDENEIKPSLFEALDAQLPQDLLKILSSRQYLIPHKHRKDLTVEQKSTFEKSTRVTIPYTGSHNNDRTYLEIDISHLAIGVYKLSITGKDLVAEKEITHTTLFRIVP